MLPAIFQRFIAVSPFCVMARVVLEALFNAAWLDELFARTAEKPYTRELLFSQLVELMLAVVLQQNEGVAATPQHFFCGNHGHFDVLPQALNTQPQKTRKPWLPNA